MEGGIYTVLGVVVVGFGVMIAALWWRCRDLEERIEDEEEWSANEVGIIESRFDDCDNRRDAVEAVTASWSARLRERQDIVERQLAETQEGLLAQKGEYAGLKKAVEDLAGMLAGDYPLLAKLRQEWATDQKQRQYNYIAELGKRVDQAWNSQGGRQLMARAVYQVEMGEQPSVVATNEDEAQALGDATAAWQQAREDLRKRIDRQPAEALLSRTDQAALNLGRTILEQAAIGDQAMPDLFQQKVEEELAERAGVPASDTAWVPPPHVAEKLGMFVPDPITLEPTL